MNAVGVDVGATKIAAWVISPGGKILSRGRYPTARTPEKLLSGMVRAVCEVRDGFEVEGACVAVPGLLLAQDDAVVYSPNLHAIEGIGLKDELEPEIGLPLAIENDNNAAAWGEFRFGAGRGADHLVYVGLGTGIGGGAVVHGRLLRGVQGAGGELGHVTIHATGPRCACGNRGCLEAFASGSAIGRRARKVAAEKPKSALGRLAAEREVLGEDVTTLAREGDEVALSVLEEAGRWLGVGLAGFVNVFNPDVVVVGGGELMLGPAREEVHVRARLPSPRSSSAHSRKPPVYAPSAHTSSIRGSSRHSPSANNRPPAVPVGKVRSVDPRGQHRPARAHQDVALSSGETLCSVVAACRSSHRAGLRHLVVDHGRAGVRLAPFRLARRLTQAVVSTPEPPGEPPLAEVVVDGLPGRVLPGQHAPRAAAPQQVEHAVGDPPSGPLGRPAALFGRAKQRFEQTPLSVGEVGRVARWGHEDLRASRCTKACSLLRRPSGVRKFVLAELPL